MKEGETVIGMCSQCGYLGRCVVRRGARHWQEVLACADCRAEETPAEMPAAKPVASATAATRRAGARRKRSA
jgi:hypothetical protein